MPDDENKKLITMEENDRRAHARSRHQAFPPEPEPNGIACPSCGKETSDAQPGVILCSFPPMTKSFCPACGWAGLRRV